VRHIFRPGQPDGFLEKGAVTPSLQFCLGNAANRSVRAAAVDAEDFAPAIIEADNAKLRKSGFGLKFSRKTRCDPFMQCFFGDAVDGIDAPRQTRADQRVQRGCGSKADDIAVSPGDVGFEIRRDQPGLRLDAIEDLR
jgi:hypothetical protein